MKQDTTDKFDASQKRLIGIVASCFGVYELVTRVAEFKTALGGGYNYFVMFITMVGCTAAMFSGWQFISLLDRIRKIKDEKYKDE